MKIRPVGAELFHVDGHTDRQTDTRTDMNLIVAFRHFAKSPTKHVSLYIYNVSLLFDFNQNFQCIEGTLVKYPSTTFHENPIGS